MRHISLGLLAAGLVLTIGGSVFAQTMPTSAPAVDTLKDAIDPYDQGAERTRFLAAVGADSEMNEKQFTADSQKAGGFVRKYDRWSVMLKYDKNGNGTIDWLEAEAYRQGVQKWLLAACDANKDGKLTGAERTEAMKLLELGVMAGDRPARMTVIATSGPAAGGGTGGAGANLTDEEKARIAAAREARMQARRDRAASRPGGGGGMNPGAVWQQKADAWKLKNFDEDGDGVLNEQEQAAAKEFGKKFEDMGKEIELKLLDTDGDGQISKEERAAAMATFGPAAMSLMQKIAKQMDTDGDGTVSDEERQAYAKRTQESVQKWFDDNMRKYDKDGDGKLNAKERDALVAGIKEDMLARIKKFDADGDGKLSGAEMANFMESIAVDFGFLLPDKEK
jgi:Ca2+-binding EF-hand superfamily protein